MALDAGAANRRRLRRRAHRSFRGRRRGRRAVLLVPVQPRRPRGARPGSRQHPGLQRRHATGTARRERRTPARGTAADQPGHAEGDRRHRGPPLLLERRDRLRRDCAGAEKRRLGRRVHAGSVDDRAATGAQPLPHPAAVDQQEAHRGMSRRPTRQAMEQGPHSRHVPQRHLLRAAGIRNRGRRPRVLRRPRQGSHARAGGAPRGAAAGAVGVRPAQPAGRCESTPGRGLTRDAPGRRHIPRPLPTSCQ